MIGKQWADSLSYLPQTGAPQVSQAENRESQNEEDQRQNQSHSLVGVEFALLLFSHLNLQTYGGYLYSPNNHKIPHSRTVTFDKYLFCFLVKS